MEQIIFDDYDEYELEKKSKGKMVKNSRYGKEIRRCALALALAIAVSTGFSAVPGKFNNMATVEAARKKDKKKPVIKLSGKSNIRVTQNESVKIPKATAKDNVDGNITKKIKVSVKSGKKSYASIAKKIRKNKAVKFTKTGKYTITYTVSDKAKNKATKKRTVTVVTKQEDKNTTENKTTAEQTTENKVTTEQVTTTATTETTTTEKVYEGILKNTKGKNATDVSILEGIVKEQLAAGANIPVDLDNEDVYCWDDNGNLYAIYWSDRELKGSISFSGLVSLQCVYCNNNNLTKLNASNCGQIYEIVCDHNELSELCVQGCIELEGLFCDNNALKKVNGLEDCNKLNILDCQENVLTELNISANTKLAHLNCYGNAISKLNVKGLNLSVFNYDNVTTVTGWKENISVNENDVQALNTLITEKNKDGATIPTGIYSTIYTWLNMDNTGGLRLSGIDWTKCNVSGQISFEALQCLRELICDYNQLTGIDVSKNANLAVLKCSHNQLSSLNIKNNGKLDELRCEYNNLSQLDITNNTELRELYADCNKLNDLNLSNNTKLRLLDCCSNQLKELELGQNVELETLQCDRNELKAVDLSSNTRLTMIWLAHNKLTNIDLSGITNIWYFKCDEGVSVTGYDGTIHWADKETGQVLN
ncbi:MAG: DUF5011 domain-containing protein [Clostridium sp.]|nr:DUF5011 domain-containing protein [Clostridium sp.]